MTLLFVPVTTLLRLLILVTAPESVPLRFVILLLVVDKLLVRTARPGTVGDKAVPAKSPDNWIFPKLEIVAFGTPPDTTCAST